MEDKFQKLLKTIEELNYTIDGLDVEYDSKFKIPCRVNLQLVTPEIKETYNKVSSSM